MIRDSDSAGRQVVLDCFCSSPCQKSGVGGGCRGRASCSEGELYHNGNLNSHGKRSANSIAGPFFVVKLQDGLYTTEEFEDILFECLLWVGVVPMGVSSYVCGADEAHHSQLQHRHPFVNLRQLWLYQSLASSYICPKRVDHSNLLFRNLAELHLPLQSPQR